MDANKKTDLAGKYLDQLHKGSNASTHKFAHELRHQATEAEQKLWSLLRNRQLKGKKFRRQHAITKYIVDFYCHESKLAIELDGNPHTTMEAKQYDKERTTALNEIGITVVRFWNSQVLNDPEKVLEMISAFL